MPFKNSQFATEMWSKLKQMFEPQDGTTRIHTLATLFHMCILSEEDVLTFISDNYRHIEVSNARKGNES